MKGKKGQAGRQKRNENEREREREKAHRLQAVKLQLVVLNQAICKHEGAVLWSWQEDTEGGK